MKRIFLKGIGKNTAVKRLKTCFKLQNFQIQLVTKDVTGVQAMLASAGDIAITHYTGSQAPA